MTRVRTCDLPGTVSSRIAFGRDAGFRGTEELFKRLYRTFCYRS
jgi:hypothetical protein